MENKTVNNTSQAEARKTILVVEDNEIVSYLLSVILEDNYNIEIRADGKEALNYLAQGNRPNLILLDVLMPNMNGYSFLRRISNKPALGKIPVIFITTIDCKKLMKDVNDMVVGYVVKPFEKEEVVSKVRAALTQ